MKRLASRATYYQKRIFPIVWFGILGLIVCGALITGTVKSGPSIMFVLVPASIAAIG